MKPGSVLELGGTDGAPRRRRRTPIEAFIDHQGKLDPKAQWVERERSKGFTRVAVRVHFDDVARVKAYAANLLKERGGGGNG